MNKKQIIIGAVVVAFLIIAALLLAYYLRYNSTPSLDTRYADTDSPTSTPTLQNSDKLETIKIEVPKIVVHQEIYTNNLSAHLFYVSVVGKDGKKIKGAEVSMKGPDALQDTTLRTGTNDLARAIFVYNVDKPGTHIVTLSSMGTFKMVAVVHK